MITEDVVWIAYRKLKQMVYYDKTDLFLRKQLAEFECDQDLMSKLKHLAEVVDSVEPYADTSFNSWLEKIDYRLVPKSLEQKASPEVGHFFTNLTTSAKYKVEKVNYFFNGPIQLHLIAVLWIMTQGRILDQQLTPDCYGSRLYQDVGNFDDKSIRLFRKYHDLYAEWRDAGIRKAKYLLTEEKRSVYLLGLDISNYYYCICVDFDKIRRIVRDNISDDGVDAHFSTDGDVGENLLRCIEAICNAYRHKISESLRTTHPALVQTNAGIPIGLCSSPLLANWHLHDFDHAIKERIRPAYYGRYVDDILMVVPSEEDPGDNAVSDFIDRLLVQTGVLKLLKDGLLQLACTDNLCLQPGKCILQHFNAKHSIAGLDKFRKKLEENASGFLLLPVEGEDGPLEAVAYDLLYSGSVNKFRSVKGVAENRFELAKHLARQTMIHLLTEGTPNSDAVLGLQQFFRGRNAIEFHDLWERVFTFFVVIGARKAADEFEKQLREEIKRLVHDNCKKLSNTTKALRKNLGKHLDLSRDLAEALDQGGCDSPGEFLTNSKNQFVNQWVQSNLIRHHFVSESLLNYTDYRGSLIRPKFTNKLRIDNHKIDRSPRYVHIDELMMLVSSELVELDNEPLFLFARGLFLKVNGFELKGIEYQYPAQKEGAIQ
ncbi:MAG: RNA-directed DNA polymerase [Syntrophobacteraceae bacterium]